MTNQDKHEEIKSLVAAHVLGSVPPEERPYVRAHILACDECLAEADKYAEVASRLALSVEEVPLPAGFADRVVAAAGIESAPARQPVEAKRGWSLFPKLAMATAAVVMAVFSFSYAELKLDLERQEQALASILSNDGGIDLKGPGGAAATVVPTETGSAFIAYGLADAPSDKTYQLWLMKGEVPVSAGTFDVDEGLAYFETSTNLDQYDGAAVTVEPAGGSLGPTGTEVVTSAV